jgi:hypothetical protein
MIASVSRAENPELFEILKTYATSRGAAIDGDVIEVKGEWTEITANGQPHRVYNLGFRYRVAPEDVMVNLSVIKNLTIIRPEGTP